MQLEFMADEPVGEGQLLIYLDEEGAEQLLHAINAARRSGHEHLMTAQWGGGELTISSGSVRTFNKVTVTFEAAG
ncbi:MAG: Imm32 family immunity protein [Sphingomicrobium sp.]